MAISTGNRSTDHFLFFFKVLVVVPNVQRSAESDKAVHQPASPVQAMALP